MHSRRAALTVAVAAGVLGAGLFAAPAAAHVEVTADNPRAGARNVTLTFTGAAESDSAGVRSQRVVLPAGIAPADVRLAKAPAGWRLTASADGYTVAGKALPVGRNAVHSIVVAQLPATATRLVFKTVETYSDGQVDRWIEVPEPGTRSDNPAPVLKLKPAATPAPNAVSRTPLAPPSPSAVPSAVVEPATSASPAAGPADAVNTSASSSSGGAGRWMTVAALVALAALVGGFLAVRRRRGRTDASW